MFLTDSRSHCLELVQLVQNLLLDAFQFLVLEWVNSFGQVVLTSTTTVTGSN